MQNNDLDVIEKAIIPLTNSSNGQENVIPHEITSQSLNILRESCTEHHGLPSFTMRHALLLNNTTDLRLKSHIKLFHDKSQCLFVSSE